MTNTRSPLPWDALASLLAVLREGSFTGAARVLGLSQPTIRRQIEGLESVLGKPLFSRTASGLLPTEAARRALPTLQEMEASAQAFHRLSMADPDRLMGIVRISASEIVATRVLPQVLPALLDRHSGLTLELAVTNHDEDLLLRETDIAVRMHRPQQAALVGKRLGRVELGFFASRRYVDRHGMPSTLSDLVAHHRLVAQDRLTTLADGLAAHGVSLQGMAVALRTDNDVAQLDAVREGVGVGVCQVRLAQRGGDLCRVLPDLTASLEAWLAVHEDLRRDPVIAAVYDHLVAHLPPLWAPEPGASAQ